MSKNIKLNLSEGRQKKTIIFWGTKNKLKTSFLFLFLFFISCFIFSCEKNAEKIPKEQLIEAKVLSINSAITVEDKINNTKSEKMSLTLKVLNGQEKGETVQIIQDSEFASESGMIKPKINQKVIVSEIIFPEGETKSQVTDYRRYYFTWFCLLLVFTVLVITGGKKGVLLSLFFSFLALSGYFLIFPLIVAGVNVLLMSFVVCLGIIGTYHSYQHRESAKKNYLIFSDTISLVIVTLLSLIFTNIAQLQNLSSKITLFSPEASPSSSTPVAVIILISLYSIISTSSTTLGLFMTIKKRVGKITKEQLLKKVFQEMRQIFISGFAKLGAIIGSLIFPYFMLRERYFSLNMLINSDVFSFFVITYLMAITAMIISGLSIFLLLSGTKKLKSI